MAIIGHHTFIAQYGDYHISVEIDSGVVEGKFPRRAMNAVRHEQLKRIEPLE